jgi:hypothetical protein
MTASTPDESGGGSKQENGSEWPRYTLYDISFEAFIRRMNANHELVVQRGGFATNVAERALVNRSAASKQAVARWLSIELNKLRDGERRIGAAPVLKGEALSRLKIADLAMTMVEVFADDIGEDLVCLLHELLDVDRHRRALADSRSEKFDLAVQFTAQRALKGRKTGVNQLARFVSVSPSTVHAWQRSSQFKKAVETSKWIWKDVLRKYRSQIRDDHPEMPDEQVFERAFEMHAQDFRSEESND